MLLAAGLPPSGHAAPAEVALDVPAWAQAQRRQRQWAAEVQAQKNARANPVYVGRAPGPVSGGPRLTTRLRHLGTEVDAGLHAPPGTPAPATAPQSLRLQLEAASAQRARAGREQLLAAQARSRIERAEQDSRDARARLERNQLERNQEQRRLDNRREQLQQEMRSQENRREEVSREQRRQEIRRQEIRQEEVRQEIRREEARRLERR